jgi:hypothetical protein
MQITLTNEEQFLRTSPIMRIKPLGKHGGKKERYSSSCCPSLAANAPQQVRNWQRRDVDTGGHFSVTGREPISRKIAHNLARSRKRAGVLCTRLNARLRATTKAAVRIRLAVDR